MMAGDANMKILSSLDYLKQDLPRLGDKVAAEAAFARVVGEACHV
jgi:hypothetical protein